MPNQTLQRLVLALGIAALAPSAAFADDIQTATVKAGCAGYTISASGAGLQSGDSYRVDYRFEMGFPNGVEQEIRGRLPVRFKDEMGDFRGSRFRGWGPLPHGRFKFSHGRATLFDRTTNEKRNTVKITFSPVSCRCLGECKSPTDIAANFNATPINHKSFIWFNANFKGLNIPQGGATLYFTHQRISFTAGNKDYSLRAPDSEIIFSPDAICSKTTFDRRNNRWLTTVPVAGDDEIFLAGLSYRVPSGFGNVVNPVSWNGKFSTPDHGVGAQWKWGAAVYTRFTDDYGKLMVKSGHQTSCRVNNGDHAGTPEGNSRNGEPWKSFVIGGATGGGGSNYTGGWSGTVSSTPACKK